MAKNCFKQFLITFCKEIVKINLNTNKKYPVTGIFYPQTKKPVVKLALSNQIFLNYLPLWVANETIEKISSPLFRASNNFLNI